VVAREPGRLASLRPLARIVAPISFAILFAVVFPLDVHGTFWWVFHTVGVTASVYTAASVFVLTLLARPASLWSRALSSRPMRYVGDRSYATYVFHMPVLYVVTKTGILSTPWFDSVMPRPLFVELTRAAILMAISIVLSALSWRFFEKPILALRNRLTFRRVRRNEIQASPTS
jgi:peptidoglycan/LPS O-acetylase OafA/YrhL